MQVASYRDVENPTFDAFAAAELDGLLRYATVLTGDRELARDLVQDVLHKVYRRWPLVAAADHPRAYVRTMVTRAFLSWRRRWSTSHVILVYDGLPEGRQNRTTRPRSPTGTRSGVDWPACPVANAACSCCATTSA